MCYTLVRTNPVSLLANPPKRETCFIFQMRIATLSVVAASSKRRYDLFPFDVVVVVDVQRFRLDQRGPHGRRY